MCVNVYESKFMCVRVCLTSSGIVVRYDVGGDQLMFQWNKDLFVCLFVCGDIYVRERHCYPARAPASSCIVAAGGSHDPNSG